MKKITILAFVATTFFACQNTQKPANPDPVHFANETDFICGMQVTPEYTDTCHYKGKVYAFCSASCKEEFQKNPEQYLAEE